MPTATASPRQIEDRVVQYFEQHPMKTVTLDELAKHTQLPEGQLKGMLGNMAKNGGRLQRIGQNAYFFSQTPLPRQGQILTGEVVGTSASGGVIIRDASGASWKVQPV